jgi:hypothetical protein
MGIAFRMCRLVDNAAENVHGWNFFQDTRNINGELPDKKDWILNRIVDNDWLRDEFMEPCSMGKVTWNQRAIRAYEKKVDVFLRSLLLLVHLTSGQPARGTELLSLRHSNTMQGLHRNIFIDNGMVSTVTSWHKGNTVTGSTKIIHRYLPTKRVSLLYTTYGSSYRSGKRSKSLPFGEAIRPPRFYGRNCSAQGLGTTGNWGRSSARYSHVSSVWR